MAIQYSTKNINNNNCRSKCPDKFGCPSDRCPDFLIRRHDTKPPFKVKLEECGEPFDVQGMVIEVNMWAKAKLRKAITENCEYFRLANDIGFEQIMIGDIIIADRIRSPEYMLVIGFDECNNLVRVQRGYRGTTVSAWKRGTSLRIFRVLNSPAQTELVFEDIEYPDGTKEKDKLTGSFLVYEWSPEDVCLPGCYWMEFKVLKMFDVVLYLPGGIWTGPIHQENSVFYTGADHTDSSVKLSYHAVEEKYIIGSERWIGSYHRTESGWFTGSELNDGSVILDHKDTPSEDGSYGPSSEEEIIASYVKAEVSEEEPIIEDFVPCEAISSISCAMSFTSPYLTPREFGCTLGDGVEWTRRFPTTGEGFLIRIEDSPTREL